MTDRAFRLDFFIAMAALVVSILTTATLVYQTHIIQEQYSAAIWPYLTISTITNPNGRSIRLDNDGLGPALVRSAQLSVDGKAVPAWNDLERILSNDPLSKKAVGGSRAKRSESSVDASTILRPVDSQTIFSITLPKGVPLDLLLRHPLAIDLCYCSLNNSCWKLHTTPGVTSGHPPQPVAFCPIGANINSYIQAPL